jgi:hypothetical protein
MAQLVQLAQMAKLAQLALAEFKCKYKKVEGIVNDCKPSK